MIAADEQHLFGNRVCANRDAEVLRRAIDRDPERRTASASRLVAELSPLRQAAEGVAMLARLATEVPDAPASDPSSLPFEETQVAG